MRGDARRPAQHHSALGATGLCLRAANAAVAYVAYLGKMLYPADLAVFYPFPTGPPPILEVVAAVSVLSAISTVFFVARRKCPYLLFGWLWYLGTLVPVIGLVQVGGQAMADRYTYLTQIGIYIAIAWGVADAARFWPGRHWLFAAASALVVAGLMVCAWQQARHWRDSEALWNHTLACTSQNPFAQNSLGLALADRGQVAEAIVHFQEAVDINPDYVDALNSLGHRLGRPRRGPRGDRPIPQGIGDPARLRGGPQQSRPRLGPLWRCQRGHRPLPRRTGNPARLLGGLQQPWHRLGRPRRC